MSRLPSILAIVTSLLVIHAVVHAAAAEDAAEAKPAVVIYPRPDKAPASSDFLVRVAGQTVGETRRA